MIEGEDVIADSGNVINEKLKGGKIGVLGFRFVFIRAYLLRKTLKNKFLIKTLHFLLLFVFFIFLVNE